MPQTNPDDPIALARQARESEVAQAEAAYQNAVASAGSVKEKAIRLAASAKKDTVDTARKTIEDARRLAVEARDRIEAKLRRQEFDKTRISQEKIVIQAEEIRVKAVKQAEEVAKRAAKDAEDNRHLAIQQAEAAEKQAVVEARAAQKSACEDERARSEQERKELKIKAKNTRTAEVVAGSANGKPAGQDTSKVGPKIKAQVPPEAAAAASPSAVIKRSGIIKLVVSSEGADPESVKEFESKVSDIRGLRLLMVSGSDKGGVQLTLKADNEMPLSGILRLLSGVENVDDRDSDIMVKLKPAV